MANGTAYEDYVCDSEYEPTTNVVRQRPSPKCAEESTERRGGGDQFLLEEVREPYFLSATIPRKATFCPEESTVGPRSEPMVTSVPEITPVS